MRARTRLAAALLAPALLLTGCGGGDRGSADAGPSAPASETSAAATPTPGQTVDKAAFLAATQKAMLDAKTYAMHTELTTKDQTMTMEGVGDLADPAAPKARVTMSSPTGGSSSGGDQLEILLVGQAMYLKMPAMGNKYVEVPMSVLADMGGQDIAKLLNPAESLKASERAVTQVVYEGEEDQGGEKLRKYTVTMDPEQVTERAATPAPTSAPTPAPTSTTPQLVSYLVWVDRAERIRKMDMTVTEAHVVSTIDKFGSPVTITAPPSSEVTQMPGSTATS